MAHTCPDVNHGSEAELSEGVSPILPRLVSKNSQNNDKSAAAQRSPSLAASPQPLYGRPKPKREVTSDIGIKNGSSSGLDSEIGRQPSFGIASEMR